MNLLLFLGSGVSYASSLPNVDEITDSIFSNQWHKNSDQTFSPGTHPTPYFRKIDITPRLQEFLQIIKSYSDKYFLKRSSRKTTYEDLFFICQQICDNEKYEIDNPAIQPFINLIKKKTKHLCTSIENSHEVIDLTALVSYSLVMINCIVHQALYTKKEPQGLNLITDLAKSYENIDIVTLNHDLLIENVMNGKNIKFIDGFKDKENDVRWFDPGLYNDNSKKIRLFKLHGSINWYRLREKKNIEGNEVTTDKYALHL